MTVTMYSPSLLHEQHFHHDDDEDDESRDDDVNDEELPSEAQLVLLCLDHLRDLRRAYPNKQDMLRSEGLDADYLSVAIYALSRVFAEPPELSHFQKGNDAFLDWQRANHVANSPIFPVKDPPSSKKFISVPNLQAINQEIFYTSGEEEEEEYVYNDAHVSNAHRFYPLDGLATNYPLTLGEITVAGLTGLGARCRIAAEMDVRESPLFDQFVVAVRNKGFFRDPDTEVPKRDPEEEKERLARAAEIHEERLRKVMGKVKEKLAHKAQQQLDDNVGDVPPLYHDHFVMSAAERLERRRRTHLRQGNGETTATTKRKTAPPPPPPRPPSTTPVQYQSSTSQSSPTSSPEQLAQRSFSSKARQESSVRANMPSPDIVLKETLSMDNPGLQRVTSSTITSPVTNTKQTSPPPPPPRDASASQHQTTDKDAADVEQAERLKAIGNAHMQKKEYALAAEAYTAALAKSPYGPHAHVYYSNRAAALLSMKRFDEAISDSECSLALKPDYGKAHARLGLAHFLLGNYQLAVEAYTTSLKYEPDNKSTKNYLDKATKRAAAIEAAASQNQHEQSLKKSSNPGLPMPKQENEERNMKVREKEAEKVKLKGNSYMANRDYEAALTNYTLAIKLSPEGPNSHVYYSNRAAALCYLERYEEAEADSEYSLRLNPTYGKAHARLGLSRFFMGDYAGAIEAYQSALEYDPDNAASKSYLQKAKARLAKQSGGSEARLKKAAVASSPVPPGSKDSFDEIMNATPDKTTAAEI